MSQLTLGGTPELRASCRGSSGLHEIVKLWFLHRRMRAEVSIQETAEISAAEFSKPAQGNIQMDHQARAEFELRLTTLEMNFLKIFDSFKSVHIINMFAFKKSGQKITKIIQESIIYVY